MSRSGIVAGLLVLGLTATAPSAAVAQDAFPSKPIQLIVPFPPGASTDLLGRYLGSKLGAALGGTVVVENRPGAAGVIGASYVAKAPPDGHTLLIASSSVTNAPQLQKTPAFDATRDLAPITIAFQHPFVLVANPNLPSQDIRGLIAYAKANPGKLNIATLGGFSDLMAIMFRTAAGIDVQVVPYRGAAEAAVGVMRGDSHMALNAFSAVQGQVKAGQLRAMAVAALHRSPSTPSDLPLLQDVGLTGFELINVIGVLAPGGTPKPVLDKLNSVISGIMSSAEAREFLVARGNDPAEDTSAAAYVAYIKKDNERFKSVVEAVGYEKK
jgi:tripartite-type tricarboxylate transporter receptor subunit TctC